MDEKLIEIGKKMNIQNNRATQLPLFVVQKVEKQVTHDGFADGKLWLGDEGEIDPCQDCVDEYEYDNDNEDAKCVNEDEDKQCGLERIYPYKEVEEFDLNHGVFLTAEECDGYIERRSYAMGRKARSFCISANRSNEMSLVLENLSANANKGEPVSQYKS